MKYAGRSTPYDRLNLTPEKPFIKDLEKDMQRIDDFYTPKEKKQILKAMINYLVEQL